MKHSDADLTPVTSDQCRQHIQTEVFGFRPRGYSEKYPKWPGMVGFEIEMMPFDRERGVMIPLQGPGSSATYLMDYLRQGVSDWRAEFVDQNPEHGLLAIALDQGDQITFEPGGQIEFSSKPYPCLSEAISRTNSIQATLDRILGTHNVSLVQAGLNPWQTVPEIGLKMTKPRYIAMDHYFRGISEYGPRMMRQTCSIQINLDFGTNETMLAKRFLLANLLSPIMTAMFANSPYCDGIDTGKDSMRGFIWQNLDKSRTGFPELAQISTKLNLESCVDAYFRHVMGAKVIFIGRGGQSPIPNLSFEGWLGAVGIERPTLADFKTHLSLHFPEVRAKGFLEMRSIDGLPRYWQTLPAVFLTGMLYDPVAMEEGLQILVPEIPRLLDLLEKSVYGYEHKDLSLLIEKIVPVAIAGFKRLPPCFQGEGSTERFERFVETMVEQHRTPASLLRDELRSGGRLSVFDRLADRYLTL